MRGVECSIPASTFIIVASTIGTLISIVIVTGIIIYLLMIIMTISCRNLVTG